MDINKIIDIIHTLKEEGMVTGAPTNSLVGGKIAGTTEAGDSPPVFRKKKKNIYLGLLSRTPWLNYIKKSKNK
jgi:hypothetical protein